MIINIITAYMPIKNSKPLKAGINLLQESSGPKTFWEKFYIWALTIGRFIIVGTEAIVLTVFVARFKLDRDVNDLADSLALKYAQLQTYTEVENEIREVQDIMYLTTSLTDNQELKSDAYKELLDIEVKGTNITHFEISENELSITATAEDIEKFNNFESTYKSKTNLLYDVTITNTSKEEEIGKSYYKFNLTAKIKSSETVDQ